MTTHARTHLMIVLGVATVNRPLLQAVVGNVNSRPERSTRSLPFPVNSAV